MRWQGEQDQLQQYDGAFVLLTHSVDGRAGRRHDAICLVVERMNLIFGIRLPNQIGRREFFYQINVQHVLGNF